MPAPPIASHQEAPPERGPARPLDNRRAIGWLLFSVVTASMMTLAVRGLSYSLSPNAIVFLRSSLTLLAFLLILPVSQTLRGKMRFSRPRLHVMRGTLIGFSTMLGFYTIAELELATVTVLFFMAPIFATLLSIFLNGERVGLRRWTAIAFGFGGACIILRPGFGELHPAMIAGLLSSLMFALALNFSRGLADADGPIATYFSSVAITAVVSLPFAWSSLIWPPSWWAWALVILLVVTGTARGYGDIQAYRLGEASVLAPVTYLRLVFIGIAGYVFFDEIPDLATLAGAVVIIGSTLYIALREARLKRRAPA